MPDSGAPRGPNSKDVVGLLLGLLVATMVYLEVSFGLYGGSPCHGDECTMHGVVAGALSLVTGLTTWYVVRSQ